VRKKAKRTATVRKAKRIGVGLLAIMLFFVMLGHFNPLFVCYGFIVLVPGLAILNNHGYFHYSKFYFFTVLVLCVSILLIAKSIQMNMRPPEQPLAFLRDKKYSKLERHFDLKWFTKKDGYGGTPLQTLDGSGRAASHQKLEELLNSQSGGGE